MPGRVSAAALELVRNETELGRRMYARGFVLRGKLSVTKWRQFLRAVAKSMNMTPAGKAAAWRYPLHGKGGCGTTICQPITESFIVLDTWPDHDGAYLFICSCRQFFPGRDLPLVISQFDLEEDDVSAPITLKLDRE